MYNKLSKTCCVSSQQANSVIQHDGADVKMHPDPGAPDNRGPHAIAQLSL